jgi:hypothetical protein
MPTITIHNAETNEVIEREMTIEEKAQYDKDQAESKARKELQAQLKAEAAAKKAGAEAKLAALGLDADDLKALGLA